MKVKLHEDSAVVLTLNNEGVVRYWRVVDDGSFVEYEGYPADARSESAVSEEER